METPPPRGGVLLSTCRASAREPPVPQLGASVSAEISVPINGGGPAASPRSCGRLRRTTHRRHTLQTLISSGAAPAPPVGATL